jgi:hypothetical protein
VQEGAEPPTRTILLTNSNAETIARGGSRLPVREYVGKPDPFAEAFAKASCLPADTVVRATVGIDQRIQSRDAFIQGMSTRSDTQRELEIEAVETETAEILRPYEDAFRAFGAVTVARLWLGGPALIVDLRAEEVERLAEADGVSSIELAEPGGEPTAWYTMDRGHDHQGLMSVDLHNNGWNGSFQNRTDSSKPIRVGLLEHTAGNYVASAHVGYQDWAGGSSRVKKVMDCGGGACVNSAAAGGATHGQAVASVAIGSIAQGQDPNFPSAPSDDTLAQRQHTGHAREAELYYYNISNIGANVGVALQQAVTDGVDVVNMSFGFESCTAIQNHGTSNESMTAALDAGMLLFAATGNGSDQSTCQIRWPAVRSEVVAVAGTDTSDSAVAFRDTILGNTCSYRYGGVPCTTLSGVQFSASSVGLVAPGFINNLFDAPPNSYSSLCGSSIATPAVTGSAALLLEHFRDAGSSSGTSARRFMAHMFLLGDAWNGESFGVPGGTVYQSNGVNRKSGFGRLRMRAPYAPATNLTAPWSWGSSTATPISNSTVFVDLFGGAAVPAGVTEFKVVAHWTPTDLNSTSDVTIELWNTCPAGGGASQITSDISFDYRKRIRRTDVSGKCLQVRVRGFSTPPTGQPVYLAYFYHSGVVSP